VEVLSFLAEIDEAEGLLSEAGAKWQRMIRIQQGKYSEGVPGCWSR
jgi:hypothetical protein